MKKRTVFEFVALVFLMPFLFVSCAKEDLLEARSAAFGYSVGFPFPACSFLLEPFRNFRVFPLGVVDIILMALTLYGIALLYRRGLTLPYSMKKGFQALCAYIAAHLIYNLYYPVWFLYGYGNWDKDGILGGQVCYALLFPYLFACEKMNIGLDLGNTLLLNQRVNLAVAGLLYFTVGVLIGVIVKRRRCYR